MGCFYDKIAQRTFPTLVKNLRPEINWQYLERTIQKCAMLSKQQNYKVRDAKTVIWLFFVPFLLHFTFSRFVLNVKFPTFPQNAHPIPGDLRPLRTCLHAGNSPMSQVMKETRVLLWTRSAECLCVLGVLPSSTTNEFIF